MSIRRFWTKLRHPRAMGQFTTDTRRLFGLATAIASQSAAPEVRPIHVLFGLLAINTKGDDWLTGAKRQEAVAILEQDLAPRSDATPHKVPPSDAVCRLSKSLLARVQKSDQFFVGPRDVRKALVKLEDPEVISFTTTHQILLN